MNKKIFRLAALSVFLLYAVYSLVITPLFYTVLNDAVLTNTLWLDLLDLLSQWLELFGIALIVAFLTDAVCHQRLSQCRPYFIVFAAALLCKYILSIAVLSYLTGSIDLTMDFGSYLFSYLLEIFECALCVLSVHRFVGAHRERQAQLKKASRALGNEDFEEAQILPLRRLFDKTNPVQRALVTVLSVVAGVRLLSHILSEIAFSLAGAFFTAADIPLFLFYMLLLVFLPCFLCYLFTCFLVSRLARLRNK